LETFASNRAALSYYKELAAPAKLPTFDLLLQYAQSGDKAAIQALTRMAEYLGRGIRMISAALAPREIVIVGDITTVWKRYGPVVEAEMAKNAFTRVPRLRPAYDGTAARLRSAVALVLGEDPLDAEQ
jgi:predicted NBD/HSP70 family sugar kinase